MRKNFQRQPQQPFLPSINQVSSRKNLQTEVRKAAKENQNNETNRGLKFKMEAAH